MPMHVKAARNNVLFPVFLCIPPPSFHMNWSSTFNLNFPIISIVNKSYATYCQLVVVVEMLFRHLTPTNKIF